MLTLVTFDLLSPATVQSQASQPQSPLSNFTDATLHGLSDVINTYSETSICSTNSSHPGTTINVSAFKPKRYKHFQFPVFLLLSLIHI